MRELLVALACVCVSTTALAQEDFSQLTLTPGQMIYVTDPAGGTEIRGPLSQISASELTIDGHRFTPSSGLKIARKGDPVWNGAAIGFAAGVVSGLTIGGEACAASSKWSCVIGGGLTLGALGALIDWAHSGRTTVYEGRVKRTAWVVLPTVTAQTKSVAFATRLR